jgi:hypothetical protein
MLPTAPDLALLDLERNAIPVAKLPNFRVKALVSTTTPSVAALCPCVGMSFRALHYRLGTEPTVSVPTILHIFLSRGERASLICGHRRLFDLDQRTGTSSDQ